MSYYAQQKSPGRQALGITIVVLLHLAIAYGLLTGLGIVNITKPRSDVETKVIEEVKPPPPDDAPPPPPPPTAPPPPFIPPPEIVINTPAPQQVIQNVVAVAPPPRPVAPTAPAAPAVPDSDVSERPISGAKPVFPARMLQSGREGSVDIECDVGTDGKTSNCTVVSSTGGSAFADAAMESVQHATYKPAIHNGVPEKRRHKWTIAFKLNG